MAHPGFKVLTC